MVSAFWPNAETLPTVSKAIVNRAPIIKSWILRIEFAVWRISLLLSIEATHKGPNHCVVRNNDASGEFMELAKVTGARQLESSYVGSCELHPAPPTANC